MGILPRSLKELAAYVVAFMLIQGTTMQLCLRVFHWYFLVSVTIASVLAMWGATLALKAVRGRKGQ